MLIHLILTTALRRKNYYHLHFPDEEAEVLDFPGSTVEQEFICQCRGHGHDLWSGRIPHAMEQLSPCTTTTEKEEKEERWEGGEEHGVDKVTTGS